jgi:putative transcriptional regulator
MSEQTIKHHLPDEVLAAYSAGNLPEAYSLVVATHVSLCDECRAALDSFDALGGAILEDQATVDVSDAALAATLALIADSPSVEPVRPESKSIFPAPLAEYVGGGPEDVQWRNVGGGVRQAILKTSKEATARLLYIPAGKRVPDHGHKGLELTMVLQGAFSDQVSRFARGDVEIANVDLHHDPVAEMGEDCICLAATDAPLVFKDLIPRLAQPFIRI